MGSSDIGIRGDKVGDKLAMGERTTRGCKLLSRLWDSRLTWIVSSQTLTSGQRTESAVGMATLTQSMNRRWVKLLGHSGAEVTDVVEGVTTGRGLEWRGGWAELGRLFLTLMGFGFEWAWWWWWSRGGSSGQCHQGVSSIFWTPLGDFEKLTRKFLVPAVRAKFSNSRSFAWA